MTDVLGRAVVLEADLLLVAGVTNTRRVRYMRRVRGEDGPSPVDMSGWSAVCQIRRSGTLVADLSPWVSLGADGVARIDPPPGVSRAWGHVSGVWDLVVCDPDGMVVRLVAGSATIIEPVSKTEVEHDV
ncbi:hypothetical protein CRD60_00875 [Bifidobacterium aemilianum]|uniref:Uncharacterized protein n=1 Tax=Bifidobacterium aemilianum TaxID=2493120 RepID=A0A366K9M8_9BIFI|nr:hypothetical protein [Bifidobacterium aemilianum]RBP98450.1 hypothetical protein CRD60_00875 [Bifidobacterium aemilianum]